MGPSHLFSCWVLLMGNPCHQSLCVCFHPVFFNGGRTFLPLRLKHSSLLQAVTLRAGRLARVHHFNSLSLRYIKEKKTLTSARLLNCLAESSRLQHPKSNCSLLATRCSSSSLLNKITKMINMTDFCTYARRTGWLWLHRRWQRVTASGLTRTQRAARTGDILLLQSGKRGAPVLIRSPPGGYEFICALSSIVRKEV